MRDKRRISVAGFIALIIYLLIGAILLINFPSAEYSSAERRLFIYLLLSYAIVEGCVVVAISKYNLYLFEPFSIITILYTGIFIYRPIQDLYMHSVSYDRIDLVSAGPKATVIFTIGFVAFFLGYFMKKRNKTVIENPVEHEDLEEQEETVEEVKIENINQESINTLVFYWGVFYVFCVISMISNGVSLRYLFSLGSQGERVANDSNTALLFLSNFAVSMLVVWLMIMVRSRNTALKVAITVLTLVYLIMRNGRWLILIMGLSPFVYYYSKRRKSPRMMLIAILGLFALVMFAWMQMNRYNISTGKSMDWFSEKGGITLELLMAPFESDLTTYTTFYGMVRNIPRLHPYMLGSTFFYVFILFVPRVFWAGKPDNPVRDMTEYSLGATARKHGRAVANIGEYYANFGVAGVVILMFLFGYITSRLKKMYEEPTEDRLIMYAILFPLMFQWVARGNFSGNFYYTLFAYVPIIIQALKRRVTLRGS